jgi:hypothetical protein
MTRDAPSDRGAIVRRLQETLDNRAGDFRVTPAFSARVQRLRRRRRIVRQTTQAVVLAVVVVVLAVTAVNALRPANRIDFVSPPATPPPSPAETDEAVMPASETPSQLPSESEEPSETPTVSEEPTPAPETEAPPETLTADTPLDLYGIGPIEAGMTLAEAEAASGVAFDAPGIDHFGRHCYYANAKGLEDDFVLTVQAPGSEPVDKPEDGIVVYVSVNPAMESPARTLSGIGIGSTEDEVYDTYAGQIESAPHEIFDGHYLTLVPRDASDQEYAVTFATDEQVVREIRAGFADDIRAADITGCA